MADLIRNSWIFWLILSMGLLIALKFIGRNQKGEADSKMATTSDQFSMATIFFNMKTGEGGLFFIILGSALAFFLFSLGFMMELYSLVTE